MVKASGDAVMLHNEITALDQIHKYVRGHTESIPAEVVNSIPVNHGQGAVLIDKTLKDATKGNLFCCSEQQIESVNELR